MLQNILLGTADVPNNGGQLKLYQRGNQFSIWVSGNHITEAELMNSFAHGSEEALAEMTCVQASGKPDPTILIGGMGMGFTLAAALKHLGSNARITLAELIPAVVEWNRGPLGECAGYPLRDKRVKVSLGDVGKLIRASENAFDVILLDVDNGPQGLTTSNNNWLYSYHGLTAAKNALKPKGMFAVWSVSEENKFTERLQKVGFKVSVEKVRTHGHKGGHHVIWLAQKK
jgi:spermidine synthase